MQKLQIIGNVGRDAEVIKVKDKDYTKVLVACQEVKDGPTVWWTVIIRTATEGLTKALVKGASLFAEGKPTISAYINKAGEPHPDLTLWANDFQITKFAKTATPEEVAPETAKPQPKNVEQAAEQDDLPF